MSQELEELPLFPLNTVLFPYASLQLHVFEDRYRQMVRLCMEEDRPFGIVLIRSGTETGEADPYMVGTAVRIVKVHDLEDGAMDIQVHGERRFRIRRFDESRPFLVGMVEPVVELEIEESDRASDMLSRAREDFVHFVQRLLRRQDFNVKVAVSQDPVVLSFTIANMLPIENLAKQRLLETTDTLERVEELIPILETELLESKTPTFYRVGQRELQEWIHPN